MFKRVAETVGWRRLSGPERLRLLLGCLLAVLLPVWFGPLPLPAVSLSLLWWLATLLTIARRAGLLGWVCLTLTLHSSQAVEQGLEGRYEGRPRSFTGLFEVTTITSRGGGAAASPLRFEVRLLATGVPADRELIGQHFRLAWFRTIPAPKVPQAGEFWRLRIVLRPPLGRQNRAGFDYERWLLARRISATGYVRGGHRAEDIRERDAFRAISRALLDFRQLFSTKLEEQPRSAWLKALLLGDRSGLAAADWLLLRHTGTVHLLVVSGLHIGVIAGFGYALGLLFGRLLNGIGAGDSRSWAVLFAAAFSFGYVLLSGAGVPAQRAWLMANGALLLHRLGEPGERVQQLLGAALVVLLLQPLAALQAGFWLSFGAVAWLLCWFQPSSGKERGVLAAVEAQLVVTLGLVPLLLLFNFPVAPAAPVVNLFAVPAVSLLIVPLGFLALLFECLALPGVTQLLWLADYILGWLLWMLSGFAGLPLFRAPVPWLGPFLALLLLCACWWQPLRRRAWLGVAAMVALLSYLPPSRPAPGSFQVTAFDVGQGDSVLVETHSHVLLFDTGPAFPDGSSAASSSVVPSMLANRWTELDALVISHEDADHAGGEAAVREAVAVRRLWRTGLLPMVAALPCRRGVRWVWDEVSFEFLHPGADWASLSSNASSCVLLIRNHDDSARALLPGDVDVGVERTLKLPDPAVPTLLLAPHHGSRTSSSASFVRRLNPTVVFVSSARFSRFGHPHAEVVARYERVGARLAVTGEMGALTWDSQRPRELRAYRCHSPYWSRLPLARC